MEYSEIWKHGGRLSFDKWTMFKERGREGLASSPGSAPAQRQRRSESLTVQQNTINSDSSRLYGNVYIREMSSLTIARLVSEG